MYLTNVESTDFAWRTLIFADIVVANADNDAQNTYNAEIPTEFSSASNAFPVNFTWWC